jgi:hypothetical protein
MLLRKMRVRRWALVARRTLWRTCKTQAWRERLRKRRRRRC